MLQLSAFRNRSRHPDLSYTVALYREHEWLSPRATAVHVAGLRFKQRGGKALPFIYFSLPHTHF